MTLIDSPTPAASASSGAPGAFASAIDHDPAGTGPAVTKPRTTFADLAGPVGGFILFIGFWYFMSYWGLKHLFNKPQFLLPPVHRVINVSVGNKFVRRQLIDALVLSTRVALVGLVISIVLGVGLAVIMSRSRWIERSAWPYLVALQAIPILAFVPLLGVLFGFNFKARVIVCRIRSSSPACPPQAMLAELMTDSNCSSIAKPSGPGNSPRSQLRSMVCVMVD